MAIFTFLLTLILGQGRQSKHFLLIQLEFTAGESLFPKWVLVIWRALVHFYVIMTHELDFEIGYGKQIVRNELNAKPDDLVVYITSKGNPFQSHKTKIKTGQWHTF